MEAFFTMCAESEVRTCTKGNEIVKQDVHLAFKDAIRVMEGILNVYNYLKPEQQEAVDSLIGLFTNR